MLRTSQIGMPHSDTLYKDASQNHKRFENHKLTTRNTRKVVAVQPPISKRLIHFHSPIWKVSFRIWRTAHSAPFIKTTLDYRVLDVVITKTNLRTKPAPPRPRAKPRGAHPSPPVVKGLNCRDNYGSAFNWQTTLYSVCSPHIVPRTDVGQLVVNTRIIQARLAQRTNSTCRYNIDSCKV